MAKTALCDSKTVQKLKCYNSTVVEHSTHNPKIEGSKPTTGRGKTWPSKLKSNLPSTSFGALNLVFR